MSLAEPRNRYSTVSLILHWGIALLVLAQVLLIMAADAGEADAGQFMDAHRAAVKLLYVLLFLHVAGALKHHVVDRDNVLHRMIPLIPRRP